MDSFILSINDPIPPKNSIVDFHNSLILTTVPLSPPCSYFRFTLPIHAKNRFLLLVSGYPRLKNRLELKNSYRHHCRRHNY